MSRTPDRETAAEADRHPRWRSRLSDIRPVWFDVALVSAYTLWALLSAFANADRTRPLRSFRLPYGDHLTELVRVESWFLGALPLSGHPSTVGVTGPGPWYLYLTSLPTRLLAPLLGGNYDLTAMLVNIALCASLLLAAMTMARTLTGGWWGPAALLGAVSTMSLLHHRVSPSPLMTRPATVSFYAALCLILGILVAARKRTGLHLPIAAISAVLLVHAYALNIPFVLALAPAVLVPIIRGVRSRDLSAIAASGIILLGAAQSAAGWLIAPETLTFYRQQAGLVPISSIELIRSESLGTLTTNVPLYDNELGGFPPTFDFDAARAAMGNGFPWVLLAAVTLGSLLLLMLRRQPLTSLTLLGGWSYWSYLSFRPHLVEFNAYALTPALALAVAIPVIARMLWHDHRKSRQVSTSSDDQRRSADRQATTTRTQVLGRFSRVAPLLFLVIPLSVAATYQGSVWYSPKGWFFAMHADLGDPYDGMADVLRAGYGENRLYALQLDDVENRSDMGPSYRGVAVSAWLALELQGERSCVLLQPHHDRNTALTVAAIMGIKGLCTREQLDDAVELLPAIGTSDNDAVFASAHRPEAQTVTLVPSSGGVTVYENLEKSSDSQ